MVCLALHPVMHGAELRLHVVLDADHQAPLFPLQVINNVGHASEDVADRLALVAVD